MFNIGHHTYTLAHHKFHHTFFLSPKGGIAIDSSLSHPKSLKLGHYIIATKRPCGKHVLRGSTRLEFMGFFAAINPKPCHLPLLVSAQEKNNQRVLRAC
jgi:hypothetical protein